MLIVDAQVHIWGSGPPINPDHRQVTAYSADELLKEMDEAGIDAAVIHPPGWDPNANELAIEEVGKHLDRLSMLGKFPLDSVESRPLVDQWKDMPGMLGLRFVFQQPNQQTWITDGTMDWLWPEAARAGLPVALNAARFLPAVGQVAERHPETKLFIDHLGTLDGVKDEAAFANLTDLLDLAKYPNVAVKATGAPGNSCGSYPYNNIHKYLRRIYDAFGPERMFWGTDITRMPCSWRQCVTMFTEELSWLSESDKELIMGRALCAWLDWKLPA